MIRKFEDNDIDDIMQIWKSANIKAHNFISNEYWENNYEYVKSVLPNAELYVYLVNNKIIGFIGMNTNYIEGIFVETNSQYNRIGTLLLNKVKENRNNLILRVYKKKYKCYQFL